MTNLTSKFVRLFTVLAFVLVTIQLWALSVSAADTHTTVRILANGKTETCTYSRDFITTRDGSHMIRNAYRCVTK